MAKPRQMIDHTLHGVKGWWHDHSLDFAAPLDSSVTSDVHAGRVVSLNASGKFVLGFATTDMPIFLRNASYDEDVVNDGGDPETEAHSWVSAMPGGTGVGKLTGLVATSATELVSTEYDSERTYEPGDTLTASNTGLITNENAVVYTNPVCGVVSRGVGQNGHGIPALYFWPVYMPTAS